MSGITEMNKIDNSIQSVFLRYFVLKQRDHEHMAQDNGRGQSHRIEPADHPGDEAIPRAQSRASSMTSPAHPRLSPSPTPHSKGTLDGRWTFVSARVFLGRQGTGRLEKADGPLRQETPQPMQRLDGSHQGPSLRRPALAISLLEAAWAPP